MKFLTPSLICLVLAGCNDTRTATGPVATNQDTKLGAPSAAHSSTTATASDRTNTAVNTRDRDGAHKTSLDQNENQADINITAGIRKKVVAEKMSVEAHNVKIITQDGKVTLRGPVKTDDEKQKIEEIAKDVAGADKVDSQLEVAGS
jgi:hyperosmotically inducible protein